MDSLYCWTLLHAPIILKNALNKSFAELNLLQKIQWMRISISARVEAREHQRIAIFKIDIIRCWKRDDRFTLGLNAEKNTDHIE